MLLCFVTTLSAKVSLEEEIALSFFCPGHMWFDKIFKFEINFLIKLFIKISSLKIRKNH